MTQLKEGQKTRHCICLYLHGTPCIAVRILAARISGIIQNKFKGLISDCGYGGLQIHKLVKHGTPSEEDYPVKRTIPDLVHLGVLPSDIEKYFSKPDCTKQDLTPSARASLESMKRWYIENQLELDVVPEIQLLLQSMNTMECKKIDNLEIEPPRSVSPLSLLRVASRQGGQQSLAQLAQAAP